MYKIVKSAVQPLSAQFRCTNSAYARAASVAVIRAFLYLPATQLSILKTGLNLKIIKKQTVVYLYTELSKLRLWHCLAHLKARIPV
jgi:hypothetical protein